MLYRIFRNSSRINKLRDLYFNDRNYLNSPMCNPSQKSSCTCSRVSNRLLWILQNLYRAVHCVQKSFGNCRSYICGLQADACVVIWHETQLVDPLVAVECKHLPHVVLERAIDAFNVEYVEYWLTSCFSKILAFFPISFCKFFGHLFSRIISAIASRFHP